MPFLSIRIEKTRKKIMEKINELNDIRKLATIARILDVKPIEGADNIEKVFVRGWQCVAKKGEYKPGDLCVYVEVDSIMPDGLSEEKREEWRALNKQMSKVSEEERQTIREKMDDIVKFNTRPEFEFLRDKKFHIRTRRILGEISQGICFPLTILSVELQWHIQELANTRLVSALRDLSENIEGYDVTNILGVTQYIAPDPAIMGGDAKGELQAVGILVSDEERIENLSGKYEQLKQFTYYKTEKLEGTSFAAYLKNGKFGVCGRTIDYKEPDDEIPFDKMNVYWKVAKQLDLEEKMRAFADTCSIGNFAIQGELVGEGIQKNIYKLKGQTVCFYNAFLIDKQEYMDYDFFISTINKMGLNTVPILDDSFVLPDKAEELLKEADITTTVFGNNPAQLIEGFVFVAKDPIPATVRITRAPFQRLSFKAKSRTYDMSK